MQLFINTLNEFFKNTIKLDEVKGNTSTATYRCDHRQFNIFLILQIYGIEYKRVFFFKKTLFLNFMHENNLL